MTGYVSVPEAAERSGRHPNAIYNAIYRGRLPFERVGRIYLVRMEDVADYVASVTTGRLTNLDRKRGGIR